MLARQIINAQDIENFFGKKEATAYKILKKVKKYYNKEYITIRDFCDYYKMERKDMIESILAAEKALKPAAKSE